jgi:hypothetical protein
MPPPLGIIQLSGGARVRELGAAHIRAARLVVEAILSTIYWTPQV